MKLQKNLAKFVFLAGVFVLFDFSIALGQQDPQYTHYMFNTHMVNPAYAGRNPDYICATLLYHNQWTGFTDAEGAGAPVTQTFDVSAPLNRKFIKGAGLTVLNDGQGFENTLAINLTGSYMQKLAFGNLTFGLNIGMIHKTLNPTWLAKHVGDPLLTQVNFEKTMPDLGVGILFERPDLYVGLSAAHLLEPALGWGVDSRFARNYYLTAGYNYALTGDIDIRPSILMKTEFTKLQYDITALGYYMDKYWGGLNYRGSDAISILLGLNVIDNLDFGYSYDLPIGNTKVKLGGTHEVMLRYCWKFKIKEPTPPNIIWTPRFL